MRLPAEWEPQSGIQLTWPHKDTEWYELDKVLDCYVDIAYNILRFEPLMIVARNIEEAKKDIVGIAGRKGIEIDFDRIYFHEAPLNDTWARDHGGIAVHGDNGEKYLYDFVFNGWGLKFASNLDNMITKTIFSDGAFEDDVMGVDMRPYVLEGGSIDTDGQGTLLTTTECLCSVNRNEYLDHTIAYMQCTDTEDPHYEELSAMERQLRTFRTMDGKPYDLVPLPLPDPLYLDDYRLPASYANFLIVNGGVLLPGTGSGSEKDEIARKRLQEVFPDRKVVLVDCKALLSGHGSLHCVTMQFPKGYLRNNNIQR